MQYIKLNTKGFSHTLVAVAIVVSLSSFGTYKVVMSSAATRAGVVSVDTSEGCWLAGRVWTNNKCSRDCRNKNSNYKTKNSNGYCEGHVAFAADANRCTQTLHRYYIDGLNGCARKPNQTDGADQRYCLPGFPYYNADFNNRADDSSTTVDICEKNKQQANRNETSGTPGANAAAGTTKQPGKTSPANGGTTSQPSATGKGNNAGNQPTTNPVKNETGQQSGNNGPAKNTAPKDVKVYDIQLRNLRDASASSDGKILKPGVLYRSSRLAADVLSVDNAQRLSALLGKNATILDVRTKRDASASPDRQIVNASYKSVPIEGILDQTPMVTDPVRRIQLKRALLTAADAKGDVLVHCFAGKDRTGWIVAMIMYNSGASDTQVMTEYMRSQKAWPDGVKEVWMANGVNTAKKNYGSIRGYLTKGVGMSDAELTRLDQKFGAK